MDKGFPTSAGLYIAQRDNDIALIKVTGMYPTLQLGKSIDLRSLITGNSLKEADKDMLKNIAMFSNEWSFKPIEGINMSAFPKTSFKPDGRLDVSADDYIAMRKVYYRLSQNGTPFPTIAHALSFEYKIGIKQMLELMNQFDSDAHAFS